MALPFSAGAIRGLLKEIEASSRGDAWIAVGGAQELAGVLRRELLADGGAGSAVRVGEPKGAAVYVHVVAGGDADEAALKRARRARVPIVAVATGAAGDETLPYVLATDVVRVGAGAGFPLDEIARTISRRLGETGAPLAARVPLLRDAVCAELVSSFARRNALISAAVFVPGADLPLLTLNQLRLVLRIAQAHGEEVGQERLPEVAATLGLGLGLRAAARELLDLVPPGAAAGGPGLRAGRRRLRRRRFQRTTGWALKGAVAYAGTRALGEAAIRRFAAGATRPPA